MSKCEKKCIDCIHFDMCAELHAYYHKVDKEQVIPFMCNGNSDKLECGHYKSKSLCVELPCKVGDKVYVDEKTWGWMLTSYEHCFIRSKCFLIGEVVSIIKTRKQQLIKIRISSSNRYIYRHKRYPVSAIGKTVFFTKEEAERKLSEVGE